MATFVEPAAAQAAAAVVQALQDVDEEYNSECIPISNNSSSDSIVNKASISESLRQTEELAWIRHRLARKRQATRESEALRRQQQHNRSDDSRADPVGALGTLQLRRLLRAVGLLSEDLARERSQETLADKVREAIATGRFASYVEEQRLIPKDSFQCVVQMRKTATIVALMENILAASSARSSSTSSATPSSAPPLIESALIPPGKSWCLPKIARSRTASTEEVSPPSSPSLCLLKASSGSNEDFEDSPHTPETLPATPFRETPSTTSSDSTVAKRVLPKSPVLRHDGTEDSSETWSLRDDAAGGMRDGREHVRSALPFAKKLTEKAEAPGSVSGRGGGLFSSREKGAVPPEKKEGGSSVKNGSSGKKWGFTPGSKGGISPGEERHKSRVASSSKWCRVEGRGWVLQEKAIDAGVEATDAQTTVSKTTSDAYDSSTASMTTSVTPTQGVPSPAAVAAESSSPSLDSASIPQTSPKIMTESRNSNSNGSSKKSPVEPLSEGEIGESSSTKPAAVEKGSPAGAKSTTENDTADVITTKSSSNCKPSSTNTAGWGPPSAAPLLRKKMAAMVSEKQKKSSQQVEPAVKVQSSSLSSSLKSPSDGGYAGGICVSSNRNKAFQQDRSRLGNMQTGVTHPTNGKVIRCGKAATSALKSGVSSKSGTPPPVPPRPRAPPVPPRPEAEKKMSPPLTASNRPGHRAGGRAPTVTWDSNISGCSSTSSNYRPLLVSGGLLKSGSPRPILSAGGVGVNRSGVIRPVTPSRLPTAVDYDDDSGSDNAEGTSINNNSRGEPARSKVLMPSAAAMMNNNKLHAAAMMPSVALQQQKQMALPKPFKAKNIEVIFADNDDHQDGEGSGKGYDSDSEADDNKSNRDDSDSEEEENDPEMKMLEPAAIPEWAKPETLKVALERQYGGEKPINPSTIFIDFYTCNLESIFDTKKKKWERKSTGDWMTDRLTIAEKLAYDRAMGYVTINSHSTKGMKGKCENGTA